VAERLAALAEALEAQASKLRDLEVSLIGRIADVDDDRRRTANEVRRALDAHREEVDEDLRRRGLVSMTFIFVAFLISIGTAVFSLFQIHSGKAEISGQLGGIQDAVAHLSKIDTAPLDKRLGQLDEAVSRLSGDLEEKVEARQTGVSDLASRLKGLEETLASQPEQTATELDALSKEVEKRAAADKEIAKQVEALEKANERLGKDLLLLRDSLTNTLAAANLPLEQRASWSEEVPPSPDSMAPAAATGATSPKVTAAQATQGSPQPPTRGAGADSSAASAASTATPAPGDDALTLGDQQQALQLISFVNLEDARRFAQRPDMPARVYYREEGGRGRPWYVIYYGLYQDQAAAAEAKAALPADLAALKPFVRHLEAGTRLQVLQRAP